MREILFRGFCEDKNGVTEIVVNGEVKRGEWVYGAYCKFSDKQEDNPHIISYLEDETFGDWFQVIPETVGQFTGLTDKNGKRIFEGDIFLPMYNGFSPFPVEYEKDCRYRLDKSKVIGTIFDKEKTDEI